MRVYEYAKEMGLSTKEVVALLHEGGFSVSSHMAVIPEPALAHLKAHAKKASQAKAAPESALPLTKVEEPIMPIPSVEKKSSIAPVPSKESPKLSAVSPTILQAVPKKNGMSSIASHKEHKEESVIAAPSIVVQLKPILLSDFAILIHKPFTEVIFTLLKWKILSNKNQLLSVELVQRLSEHYQLQTVRPETQKQQEKAEKKLTQTGQERLPIVVVMGHVDHGKTTLLDFIRKTRVAAREKGGITQHLGAYEAKTPQGSVVFLDTPGHEAFSKIRMRGAKVADISILVVAADDGVMPQTIEAIKQAQAMGTPIVVAINKMDKAEPQRVEIIKNELGKQFNLLPEEWGGSTIYVPISAKLGTNVDKLLDLIVLQSQMMELKADASLPARGYILEAKAEKGLGTVATFIAQEGTLRVGDYFICGATSGKVSALIDSFGNRLQQVGPSVPAQIAGFNEMPEAGDFFEVVSKETFAQSKRRTEISKSSVVAQSRVVNAKDIKIIVKTDAGSSQEALIEGIAKLSKKLERGYSIVHAAIGNVSDSDVMLAADTGARLITLHVKAEPTAFLLAQQLGVSIQSHDIIYKLLESLEEYSNSLRVAKMVRKKIGQALVRKVFDIKDLGVIAGSYVREGIFTRDGSVEIWRGSKKIGQGPITSLQRDRKAVKEVHAGFECAFMVGDFTEWEVDDRVECFAERPESSAK